MGVLCAWAERGEGLWGVGDRGCGEGGGGLVARGRGTAEEEKKKLREKREGLHLGG